MLRSLEWRDGKPVIVETPLVCSARQARLAMLQTPYQGTTLLAAAQSAVDGSDDPALQVSWGFATEWRREEPAIAQIGAALGLTDGQIDDLFRLAMSL